MIDLLRQYLPYLFVLFFLVKANKEPLYLLGIPFLMFMSNSIFFEGVKVFNQPTNLTYGRNFIWLVVMWVVALLTTMKQKKIINDYRPSFNSLDFCVLGLTIITIADLLITFVHYPVSDIMEEFIHLISLFLGYFIIKDWISRNKMETVLEFLFSIVVINTIASILFIIHQGLSIHIYEEKESIQEYFAGEEITRSFWFAPQLLFFSIAFLFLFRKSYPRIYRPLLLINIFAVFITYTRSYVVIIVVIFLLYFLLTGIKEGKVGQIFKNIFLYGILGIFGIFIVSKILPAKSKYFMDRFNELSSPSSTQDPNNLEFRFMKTGEVILGMDANAKVLGMGPVTEKQISIVPDMLLATSDMVWTGVIFRWGFVGLLLFALLYGFSLIKSYQLFMKNDGLIAIFALFFFIYSISEILESFVSWTFLSEHGFVTGLWYFAGLSWLLGFNVQKENLLSRQSYPEFA